jgi:hypothetical protein
LTAAEKVRRWLVWMVPFRCVFSSKGQKIESSRFETTENTLIFHKIWVYWNEFLQISVAPWPLLEKKCAVLLALRMVYTIRNGKW